LGRYTWRMEKEMQLIKVRTNENYVIIEQEQMMHEEACVIVHPGQIPTLIKWLQEAAAELAEG
jgi:hypothetical protein